MKDRTYTLLELINLRTGKKWKSDDIAMRSCWKCNGAHKHLKKSKNPIWCFSCGNIYYLGKVLK